MTDHPEYRAHLAGILAHPADDIRRLVLADWLEEHAGEVECRRCEGTTLVEVRATNGSIPSNWTAAGWKGQTRGGWPVKPCPACSGSGRVPNGYAERAEFIRVQVDISRLESPRTCLTCGVGHTQACWHGRQLTALRRRERELWDYGPVRQWFGVVGQDVNLGLDADGMPASSRPSFIVRRGLVAEVRVPTLAAWLGGECQFCGGQGRSFFHPNWHQTDCTMCHATGRVEGIGRAVCDTQPVERVEVADLEPLHAADLWWFHCRHDGYRHWPGSCRLPVGLVDAAGGYPSREAAKAALSAALIALARH